MSKRFGRTYVVLATALIGIVGGCAGGCGQTQPDVAATAGGANSPAPAAAKAPASVHSTVDVAGPAVPVEVPVASLDGHVITREQLLRPLMEAHGLNFLLGLVSLEAAKIQAASKNIVVTPDDIKAERESTMSKLFRESDERYDDLIEQARRANKPHLVDKFEKQKSADRDALLKQFLEQQRISPGELDVVLETNTYLRKIVEPVVRANVTEDMLRKQFAIKFNERVKARHIELRRLQDCAEVLRRIREKGEPFEKVAREMSTNPQTRGSGGDLPPFTHGDPNIPQNIRDIAFSLKKDQISDPVEFEGSYHLLQVVDRIPPKNMPFEQVRESLLRDFIDTNINKAMNEQRERNALFTRQALRIQDPLLQQQWQAKIDAFNKAAADAENRAKLDLEAKKLREGSTTQPATRPAEKGLLDVAPPAAPATRPAVGPAPMFDSTPMTKPAEAPPAAPAAATKPVGATTRPTGSPK